MWVDVPYVFVPIVNQLLNKFANGFLSDIQPKRVGAKHGFFFIIIAAGADVARVKSVSPMYAGCPYNTVEEVEFVSIVYSSRCGFWGVALSLCLFMWRRLVAGVGCLNMRHQYRSCTGRGYVAGLVQQLTHRQGTLHTEDLVQLIKLSQLNVYKTQWFEPEGDPFLIRQSSIAIA